MWLSFGMRSLLNPERTPSSNGRKIQTDRQKVRESPLAHFVSERWGGTLAHPEVPHTTTLLNLHLHIQPRGGQVLLLVFCVAAKEDKDIIGGESVLQTGV